MDTKPEPTRNIRHIAIRLSLVAAVATLAMKIHAEVTINFSSTPFGTNLKSDGSAMDSSFTFELGAFANGFVPTAGNTDQWLANWVPVSNSGGVPIPNASTQYGSINHPVFGTSYDGFASELTLDHNNSPFQSGSRGYIWGYDSQSGDSEWILLTNTNAGTDAWTFPDATAPISFSESWSVGNAGQAIIGSINFNDPVNGLVSMQSGNVSTPPVVPEPSTAILLTASALALGLGRRRPNR